MKRDRVDLTLSLSERECLLSVPGVPEDIRALLAQRDGRSSQLILDLSQVETLKNRVAEQLLRRGFDKDWEPNEQGAILEGVIDKLQPPKTP